MQGSRVSIWSAALLIGATLVSPSQAQQCVLDPDGDGQTSIGELIRAVNQALDGCDTAAPPTPTVAPSDGCPFDFGDSVDPTQACPYRGLATSSCPGGGSGTVRGAWFTVSPLLADGQVLITLTDQAGTLGIFATRTSANSATVTQVAAGPSFSPRVPATGTVALTGIGELAATISPQGQRCSVVFAGAYDDRAK